MELYVLAFYPLLLLLPDWPLFLQFAYVANRMRALITLTLKTAGAGLCDKTTWFRSPENRNLNICAIVACTLSENVGVTVGKLGTYCFHFHGPRMVKVFYLPSPSPRPEGSLSLQSAYITGSVSDLPT